MSNLTQNDSFDPQFLFKICLLSGSCEVKLLRMTPLTRRWDPIDARWRWRCCSRAATNPTCFARMKRTSKGARNQCLTATSHPTRRDLAQTPWSYVKSRWNERLVFRGTSQNFAARFRFHSLRYVYPACKHTREVTCFELSQYRDFPNKVTWLTLISCGTGIQWLEKTQLL